MEKNNIWSHLSRKFFSEPTAANEKEINTWIEADKMNKHVFNRLKKIHDHHPENIKQYPEIYQKINHRIKWSGKRNHNMPLYLKVASVAASIILISALSFFAYHYYIDLKPDEIVLNEIAVPKGNRTKITLADGSKVWLGNDTKFYYPPIFSEDQRKVSLSGEAYFEVKSDKKHPFIVELNGGQVEVLGTKFSVHAYDEDNFIEAALIEGEIQFKTPQKIEGHTIHKIKPGEHWTYRKDQEIMEKKCLNKGIYSYWFDGIYEFNEETLESLGLKINRIYNVSIIFEDEIIKDKTFTGSIGIDDNVYTFLEAIKRTSTVPIDYHVKNNNIYFKLN